MKPTVILAAALLAICLVQPAMADTTTVTVPFGDWLGTAAGILQDVTEALLAVVVAIVLPKLPIAVRGIVQSFLTPHIEQLLVNAINYGLNTVAGAEKGKSLEVDVGNAVVAQALQYAIDHGAPWLIDWAGGADAIAEKIIARLDLVAGSQGSVTPGVPLDATPAAAAPAAAGGTP